MDRAASQTLITTLKTNFPSNSQFVYYIFFSENKKIKTLCSSFGTPPRKNERQQWTGFLCGSSLCHSVKSSSNPTYFKWFAQEIVGAELNRAHLNAAKHSLKWNWIHMGCKKLTKGNLKEKTGKSSMMKVNQSMGFRFDSLICDSDICKVGWPKQFGEFNWPPDPIISQGMFCGSCVVSWASWKKVWW